jgi:hypothetical protein
MGVDLISESGAEFRFTGSGWGYVIAFAEAHGFTWPTDDAGEDEVTLEAREAGALADAIERGIGAGTADEVARRVSRELTELLVTTSKSSMFPDAPIVLQARTIEYWREFVRFARSGGFSLDIQGS